MPGAWKRKIRSKHLWKMLQRPALKPTLGESSLSRQAALASGWSPPIKTDSGDVKKEGIGRSSMIEFQVTTIEVRVLTSWMLVNRQLHLTDRIREHGFGSSLCARYPSEGFLDCMYNILNTLSHEVMVVMKTGLLVRLIKAYYWRSTHCCLLTVQRFGVGCSMRACTFLQLTI